jgi:hypothetical protein
VGISSTKEKYIGWLVVAVVIQERRRGERERKRGGVLKLSYQKRLEGHDKTHRAELVRVVV